MVNPFRYDSSDLVSLSSGVVATASVAEDLITAHAKGEVHVMTYISDRIQSAKVGFHETIPKLKLQTFSGQLKVKTGRTGTDTAMKSDRNLFARMIVLSKHREIDLRKMLSHCLGVVSYPLANTNGSIAKTNKAALLNQIEELCQNHIVSEILSDSALIVDLMAVVHSLPSNLPPTFGQLATYILRRILLVGGRDIYTRLDIVSDRYPAVSIKEVEHSRWYSGACQQHQIYSAEQKVPTQWKSFLASGSNKEALVEFLFQEWSKSSPAVLENVQLFVAHSESCHLIRAEDGGTRVTEVKDLHCDHEEADSRMILHAKHAADNHAHVVVQSPDTDVFIILLSCVQTLPCSLYFLTGTKNRNRIIDLQVVSKCIGINLCRALIGLHVFTGCDTVSAFHGKGKTRAYTLTAGSDRYIQMFTQLGNDFSLPEDLGKSLEAFVCKLYSQGVSNVDDARYRILCTKAAVEQSLPPTSDPLLLHSMRANVQAAIHRHSREREIAAPSPIGHGWCAGEHGLDVQWMTKDPIPRDMMQHLHCGCKKKPCNSKKCSCRAAQLSCTDICECTTCENREPSVPEQSLLFDVDESDIDSE